MYACICNAIKESELRKVAKSSPGDAEALYQLLGRQPQCRQCLSDSELIVADARAAANVPACIPS